MSRRDESLLVLLITYSCAVLVEYLIGNKTYYLKSLFLHIRLSADVDIISE